MTASGTDRDSDRNGCEPSVVAYEALWGLTGSLRDRLAGIKQRGYDGVETGVPSMLARLGVIEESEAADLPHLLADLDLSFLPMVFTVGPERGSRHSHEESLDRQFDEAMSFEPRMVTAHTGTDSMPLDAALDLFGHALELERQADVAIGHETHRGRILYTPFAWRDVHSLLPDLRVVADLSHWVTVCERLPEDIDDLLASCCQATIHVHARVGQPEAPQVADPRTPASATAVAWHERWWRAAFDAQVAAGAGVLTFDPEYGPPPYLPVSPATGEPVADLTELRTWATERLRRIASDAVAAATGAGTH